VAEIEERTGFEFFRNVLFTKKNRKGVRNAFIGQKASAPPCPECKKPLRRIKGKSGFFWGCTGFSDGCKYSCDDKRGKPVAKAKPATSSKHECKSCGKALVRRPGQKSGHWWSCSGYPECKQTYQDKKNAPIYPTAEKTA